MKPCAFTYHRPGTVPDALALLQAHGAEAKVIAGGQSLGPMLNMRLARPGHLVDLNDLLELDYLRPEPGLLEIGAMTRHHRLATAPELANALPLVATMARTIGHYAIRQRGTIGGSLVHADPAAQLPLAAVVHDAEMVLHGRDGTRLVPARDFLQSIMTVDLAQGEILTAVRFPLPEAGTRWAFELFSRRHGDFAIASVALMIRLGGDGRVAALRLGLGGVDSVPIRLGELEERLCGEKPDSGFRDALATAAAGAIRPETTAQLPAAYRRDLVQVLVARALDSALAREVTP